MTGQIGESIPVSARDKAHLRDVDIHTMSGTYIRCCEVGETDCPCICHTGREGVPA